MQKGTCRKFSVRMGRERLSVYLTVGIAEVSVTLEVTAGFWETDQVQAARKHRWSRSPLWELADFPTTPSSLRAEIEPLCRQCGCDDALTQRVTPVIVDELTRQVTKARVERDRRLSSLPVATPLEWDEIGPALRNRRGIYTTDLGSIEITIRYPTEVRFGGSGVPVLLVSTRSGRRRESEFRLSLDGICSEGVVQTLETWGCPTETALGVGRAVAIQARADWLALYPTWRNPWQERVERGRRETLERRRGLRGEDSESRGE